MKNSRNKIKKLLSYILIVTILLPIIPIGELKVYAFDQEKFMVERVVLIRNYDKDQNSLSATVSIFGEYLQDAAVGIFNNIDGYKELPASSRQVNRENILQFKLAPEEIGSKLYIGNKEITLQEEDMPNITGISTKKVEEGKQLKLDTTNLNQILSRNIKVFLDREGETEITHSFTGSGTEAIVSNVRAKTLGQQNIVFKKTGIQRINFNPTNPNVNVEVNITYTYQDQFLLYKPIKVDNLVMKPTRGIPGDTIYFESPVKGTNTDLNRYDVFFMKTIDGTDDYRLENKGVNTNFQPRVSKDGIEYNILTTQVPANMPVGEYFVVFTNVVPSGKKPMDEVSRELILEQRFRVIDGEKRSSISLVYPKEGPDTGGTNVTILGKFFGSLNIDEFQAHGTGEPTIETSVDEINPKTLELSYGGGVYGDSKNPISIDRVERSLKVVIGVEAVFITNEDGKLGEFNPTNDILRVETQQITDPGQKKVMVEVTTIFHKSDGGTIEIIEIADEATFTYIAGQIAPEITSAVPELIGVKASGVNYETPEDRLIAIHGKNLMIHKYTNNDGEEILVYPEIRLGNIVLDKNKNPALDIKVLDKNGKVLDGTRGNELGTKILITLPRGTVVRELGKKDVRVTNPTRNSQVYGLFDNKENMIEFVSPSENLDPAIYTVEPYTSPLAGGENIVITGSNFLPGVRVFLDGEEITGIKKDDDNTRVIEFTSPKGREGQTQLQVMNADGGTASHPFVYVKTFSNPKIIDFAPKMGNTNTLVMIKGSSFRKPEPLRTTDNIFNLIGSRVLLDGQDINEYNRDPYNKNLISLKQFVPGNPSNLLFSRDERKIEVAKYYDGIMLEDESDRDYIIDINPNGEILLTDGGLNIYNIELDINNNIVALKQGGEEYKVDVAENHIVLTNRLTGEENKLEYFTPYTTSGDRIIGKKVEVIDNKTIYFRVPILPDEKHYDLTVLNPDTKRDERLGNKGFYYYIQPGLRPEIHTILPSEGSVEGGYAVDILGKGFPRVIDTKPRVFINAVEVAEKDIEVSPDGKAIRILSMPKYDGDLVEDKGTSRWAVPVVVLNPDGSTASNERGFFYVVPSSKPKIKRIDPNTGSASGGQVIKIIGEQFRYYEPYDDKNRNGQLDEDEGETYNDLNKNGRWDDLNDEDYKYTDEWKLAAGETELDHGQYDYYYDSPILPTVYFGNTKAKIVVFEEGYLEVILPKKPDNTPVRTNIYILNNDGGVSNRLAFTYEITPVNIRTMVPDIGPSEGGAISTLEGVGFSSTQVEIYKDNYVNGISDTESRNMPLVRFGNRTNANIAWDKPNGGAVSSNRARVAIVGGLTVNYNGDQGSLTLTIDENGETFTKTIEGYDNNVKYIPVNLLKSDGVAYSGKELIKVNIEGTRIAEDKIIDGRLVVERGYAPRTTFINTGEIRIDETPSYHTVQKNVPVFHINNEGGKGETIYEYKNPDSNPRIINISADGRNPVKENRPGLDASTEVLILKVNHKGRSIITIEGTDFRENPTVHMGSLFKLEGENLTLDGSTEITFKMPLLPEAAAGTVLPLLIQNDDGGFHSSDRRIPKIFIEVTKGETDPKIIDIEPIKGPSTGGTRVKIRGTDLRQVIKGFEGENLRVYFGKEEAAQKDIYWNAKDRSLEVIAPKSAELGEVEVKIDNPDGARTQDGIIFTYISRPRIKSLSPNKMFSNDTETEVSLIGEQFTPDAKVIIGGKIVPIKDIEENMEIIGEGLIGVDVNGNNREVAVVGGVETKTINVENENTIKVTFNEVTDLENTSIIVINPDGGISDPYDKFQYQVPRPDRPLVLEAIPGYESTVQLIWSKSGENILNRATNFEIYGRKASEKENVFISSTDDGQFLVRLLEENTDYIFMVRALNKYGAAIDFATVKVKTLNKRQDEKLREKEEKLKKEEKSIKTQGKEETRDGRLYISLGTDKFIRGAGTVDLGLSKYKNTEKITVAIPLELARKDNRLTIKDNTMATTINIRDMYTLGVSKRDRGDTDAYLRIHIDKIREEHLPRNKKPISQAYEIYFDYVYGRNSLVIGNLLRSGKLYMEASKLLYPQSKNTAIYEFVESTGEYRTRNTNTIDIKGRTRVILLSD